MIPSRLALLLVAIPALACDCPQNPNVCETVSKFDRIFIGTPISHRPGTATSGVETIYEFRVTEWLKGDGPSEVTVGDGLFHVGCNSGFPGGGEWLVFANPGSAMLRTSTCARNLPISHVRDELVKLRAIRAMLQDGTVTGRVSAAEPIPDLGITVNGQNRKWRAVTNAAGEFTLRGLPPGTYTYNLAAPPGLKPAAPTTFKVGPGVCMPLSIRLTGAATIQGRILDSGGNPVNPANFVLTLRRPGSLKPLYTATAGTAGAYQFTGLEAGKYVLHLARPHYLTPYRPQFYPSSSSAEGAQILHIDGASSLTLPDWRMPPPLERTEIHGVLRAPGSVPSSYTLFLQSLDSADTTTLHPGADGSFRLPVLAGERYQIYADCFRCTPKHMHWTAVPQSAESLQLTITEPGGMLDCEICKNRLRHRD